MAREEYELYHFGVKGMKWGIRKKRDSGPSSINKSLRARRLEALEQKKHKAELKKRQDAWDKNVKANAYKVYNKAADNMDEQLDAYNKRWSEVFKGTRDWSTHKDYSKYIQEWEDMFDREYSRLFIEYFGERPK